MYLASFLVAKRLSGREIVAEYCRFPIASLYSSWLTSGSSMQHSQSVCFSTGMVTGLQFLMPNRSKVSEYMLLDWCTAIQIYISWSSFQRSSRDLWGTWFGSIISVLCVLGIFAGLTNLKILMALSDVSSRNLEDLHVTESADSMDSTIDHCLASIIIS